MKAALLLALLAGGASAENGRTAAPTLSRPLGARAGGMADAFSAVAGGLDSMTYNAAGLIGLERREARADYTHGIVDDKFTFLGFAQPLGRARLAAGAAYYDAGTITLNLSNGTTGTRRVQQDWVALGGGALDLGAGLSVGGLAKFYRLALVQEVTATGTAFDGGVQWRSPLAGLSFGASFQNAGPDVKFEREGDPLPLTARAGAAYDLPIEAYGADHGVTAVHRFVFTADAIKTRQEEAAAAAGIELQLPFMGGGRGAVRAGYVFNRDIDSFSVGVGFQEGRWLFDYALGIKKAMGNAHHLSLGVRL